MGIRTGLGPIQGKAVAQDVKRRVRLEVVEDEKQFLLRGVETALLTSTRFALPLLLVLLVVFPLNFGAAGSKRGQYSFFDSPVRARKRRSSISSSSCSQSVNIMLSLL